MLRIAIPSWGRHLHDASVRLLHEAGYVFDLSDKRQYVFDSKTYTDVQLTLRVTSDIPRFVRDGGIDLGITGRDWVEELKVTEGGDVIELLDLEFGKCRIAIAVPEKWKDVNSIIDLYIRLRSSKKPLKIATEYVVLAKEFLRNKGLTNFDVIRSSGSTESLPGLEADMIVDVVGTGHTLQANLLKELHGGTIMESTTVLIANKKSWENKSLKPKIVELIDNIESAMRAREMYMVSCNFIARESEEIVNRLRQPPLIDVLKGLAGPTISPVYVINPDFEHTFRNKLEGIGERNTDEKRIWAVNLVVHRKDRFKAIEGLRKIGGSGILVFKPEFVYTLSKNRRELE